MDYTLQYLSLYSTLFVEHSVTWFIYFLHLAKCCHWKFINICVNVVRVIKEIGCYSSSLFRHRCMWLMFEALHGVKILTININRKLAGTCECTYEYICLSSCEYNLFVLRRKIRSEYTFQNVKTKPTLCRANTPSKGDLLHVCNHKFTIYL